MQFKSYESAVKYLEGFIGKVVFNVDPKSIKLHPPLDRMKMLLSLLGNPQDKFKSVLVGGTSGKGSTAYLISHILTTAGYKTSLTISPHLQKINERLQINGKSISDRGFTNLLASILDSIEGMKRMSVGAPSYFEILIAMAFLYFVQNKVDIAVVEVGMGGEYDATNTLYPLVAVITNVSLDHTNVLGGTVQKIAKTKVGIIKGSPHPLNEVARGPVRSFPPAFAEASAGRPASAARPAKLEERSGVGSLSTSATPRLVVVTGVKQPSVIKIVEDKRKEVGAELYRLGKDFNFKIKKESLEGSVFDLITFDDRQKKLNGLILSLLGKYQVENASLAIETVRQLADFGFKVSEVHIRKALKTAFFPGRFEVVSVIGSPLSVVGNKSIGYQSVSLETDEPKTGKPEAENRKQKTDNRISDTLILDGAHNPTKMKAFLTTLKKPYPKKRKIFVVGFKFDKDVKKMLKQIVQVADGIIITKFRAKTDMSNNASMEISNLKSQISNLKRGKKINIVVEKSSKSAMEKAFQIAKTQKDSIIVVTGSLYLVGEIRNML